MIITPDYNEQTYSLQITDSVYQMETETRVPFATYQSANQFYCIFFVYCKTRTGSATGSSTESVTGSITGGSTGSVTGSATGRQEMDN